MARTPSTMLELGIVAPDFSLPEPLTGKTGSPDDFKSEKGLLVLFICNHCPFVLHILDSLVAMAHEYGEKGLDVVAISANDADAYPDDSPDKMAALARDRGFGFPYLYDEQQTVAQAYRAACTPDLYLFDGGHRLVYRGQYDGARPGNDVVVTGEDLRQALDALMAGESISGEQSPSLGCNIKWKPGREPDYYG